MCLHFWKCEEPTGGFTHAVCRDCGEEIDFPENKHDNAVNLPKIDYDQDYQARIFHARLQAGIYPEATRKAGKY